ncbi:MAG: DUF1552 domain-containing protein [Myxococcota bacterium]
MQRTRRGAVSRRNFLQGLGLSAAALPFVPILESAAGGKGFPKRLIVFCTTTGMTGRYPGNWAPVGTTNEFSLSPILQPLAGGDTVNGLPISDLTGDCNFFQGIDMPAYYDSPSVGGHPRGMGVVLTGTPIMEGKMFSGGGPDTAGWAGGKSVDQELADAIGQDTAFSSIELGVKNTGGVGHLRYVLSYRDAASPLPVDSDPYAVFDRLFGDLGLDPADLAKLKAERLSVIDFLDRDLARFQSKISMADKHKMDAHLDSLRGIEMQLNAEVLPCEVPEVAPGINVNSLPDVGRVQMDMIISAMSCGLTNVASLMWGAAPLSDVFTWVPGVDTGFHELSHAGTLDEPLQDQLQSIANWYTQQYAYLLQRLKDIPEGDGTMLDNTLVLWTTENSQSNNHNANNMPYVLAGNAGGAIETGRFMQYDSVPHNELFVSICQALGHDIDQFGDPQYGSGGLVGLL